jgi:RNA polymerase sigma factor for flagellar operon FliA
MTSTQVISDSIQFPFLAPLSSESLSQAEQEQLVLRQMDDVRQIARSMIRRLPACVQLDDLIQAGSLGLVDAARRFSPARNLPFRQYARIRITGAIVDSLRELDWASRTFRTRKHKLENAAHTLETKLGRTPESDEVADVMGLELSAFYEFSQSAQSLKEVDFEPREDSEFFSVRETVAGDPEKRPDCICHQNESRNELRKFVAQLPQAEATVVILYYFKDWNMARIARSIGKTEARVSGIHGKAVWRLQRTLVGRGQELMTRLL